MRDSDYRDEAPDYAKYTVAQLLDVERQIDGTRYPERLAAIRSEIERRGDTPQQSTEPPLRPRDFGLTRRAVAAYLVVSGVISLARMLDRAVWTGAFGVVAGGLVMLVYVGMIVGGASVWRRWTVGIGIGALATLVQVPFVHLGPFLYVVSAAPVAELQLWPILAFAFTASGSVSVHWFDEPRPFYLGLNILAVLLTWAQSYLLMRRRRAQRRLRKAIL